MNAIPLTSCAGTVHVFHIEITCEHVLFRGRAGKLKPAQDSQHQISYCTWSLWLPTIYKALSTFIKSERFWHGALRRAARNVASEKRRETCQNLEVLPDPAVRRKGDLNYTEVWSPEHYHMLMQASESH